MHEIPEWVYILFTAVTAVGVLLQAFVLLGILLALKGALKRVDDMSKLAEQHVIPTLTTGRRLLEEVSPKLKVAAQNMLETSHVLRRESIRASETVNDLLKKTEAQTQRVDEMMTATLNSVAHVTATVQRTILVPVRQIGAVLNGFRAGFDVLRNKEREVHAAADGDHFV